MKYVIHKNAYFQISYFEILKLLSTLIFKLLVVLDRNRLQIWMYDLKIRKMMLLPTRNLKKYEFSTQLSRDFKIS